MVHSKNIENMIYMKNTRKKVIFVKRLKKKYCKKIKFATKPVAGI